MTTPGVYRHWKGNLYRVLLTGVEDSTNPPDGDSSQEPCVVYVALTGDHVGQLCVRTGQQFEGYADPNVRRFVWVSP